MHYLDNQELFKELLRRAHLHPEMFFDDQLDLVECLVRETVKECAKVASDHVGEIEGVDFGLVDACYLHFGV